MKVHPAMLMKTKEDEKRSPVPGVRFQGIVGQSDCLSPVSDPPHSKMKVHPAMLMKIKTPTPDTWHLILFDS
jgi:hypothetical protein